VTRKAVALKFLKPELAQKKELRQRFLREARAASMLGTLYYMSPELRRRVARARLQLAPRARQTQPEQRSIGRFTHDAKERPSKNSRNKSTARVKMT
jgi:hypothetical protein